MSAEKPYYYWDPIGIDPQISGSPKYVQLRTRSYQIWELEKWGFAPNGLEDGCWRLGLYVACHPEDDLAITSLFYLLDNRMRYFGDQPERVIPWHSQPVRYPHPKSSFNGRQLIAGVFGLVVADRIDLVKELKPVSRLAPTVRAWLRFLNTGEEKDARRFHLLMFAQLAVGNALKTLTIKSRHQISLMLFLCPDPDCSKAVMEGVAKDNLLLHLLNDYDEKFCLMIKPEEYVSRKGYAWHQGGYLKGTLVDDDDPIKLDKELLIKISEIWIKKKLKTNPMSLIKAMFGNGSPRSIRN